MRTVATVARTMAEQGEICPDCTHPWGRHQDPGGCASGRIRAGRRKAAPCSCTARPARRGVTVRP